MTGPLKPISLTALSIALFAIGYIACNKDNSITSKTIVKCVTCLNGGACIRDTCRCPAAYEGISCQTESILKFTQNFAWTVSESGSVIGPKSPYNISIEPRPSSLTTLLIYNLYGPYYSSFYSSVPLNANINGDSIFIPTQVLDSGYITGKGYYVSNSPGRGTITFRYQVTNTITGVTNDFGYANPANNPSIWTQD